MALLFVHNKPFSVTPPTPTGWTLLGSVVDGSVSSGNDSGSVRTTVFYRRLEGGDVAPTITLTGNNVGLAVIRFFRKTSAYYDWSIAGDGGGDTTADTTFSITAATNPGITAGDWLVGGAGIRSDAGTQASIALTAAGATVDAATETPATDGTTTTGNDLAASGAYAAVTAGTATAAPVYAATLAAAHTGSAFIVRLREMPKTSWENNFETGIASGSGISEANSDDGGAGDPYGVWYTGDGVGNSAVYSTEQVYADTRSGKLTASATASVYLQREVGADNTKINRRWYVYATALPTGMNIAWLSQAYDSTGANADYVGLTSGAKLALNAAGSTVYGTSNFPLNQWVRLETEWDNGTNTLRWFATPESTTPTETLTLAGPGTGRRYERIGYSFLSPYTPGTVYIDHWKTVTGGTWIGPLPITHTGAASFSSDGTFSAVGGLNAVATAPALSSDATVAGTGNVNYVAAPRPGRTLDDIMASLAPTGRWKLNDTGTTVADEVVDAPTPELLSANQQGVETDLTGFTAYGSPTLTRSTAEKNSGAASLRVQGNFDSDGFYARYTSTIKTSQGYRFTVWLKGTGTVRIQAYQEWSNHLALLDNVVLTSTWTQYTLDFATWHLTSATSWDGTKIDLMIRQIGAGSVDWYADDLSLKQRSIEGTYTGSYTQGVTKIIPNSTGTAVDFTGGHITVAPHHAWQLGESFSLSWWMVPDTNGGYPSPISAGSGQWFAWYRSTSSGDDNLVLRYGPDRAVISGRRLFPGGSLNYCVITYDRPSQRFRCYVNGVLLGEITADLGTVGASLGLRIGTDGTYPHDGRLQDVAVFNYELPASSVEEVYLAGTSGAAAITSDATLTGSGSFLHTGEMPTVRASLNMFSLDQASLEIGEGGATSWPLSATASWNFEKSSEQAFAGSYSYKMTKLGTALVGEASPTATEVIMPYRPSNGYSYVFRVFSPVTSRSFRCAFFYYRQDGSYISGGYTQPVTSIVGQWTAAPLTNATPPEGAYKASLFMYVTDMAVNESHYFDGFFLAQDYNYSGAYQDPAPRPQHGDSTFTATGTFSLQGAAALIADSSIAAEPFLLYPTSQFDMPYSTGVSYIQTHEAAASLIGDSSASGTGAQIISAAAPVLESDASLAATGTRGVEATAPVLEGESAMTLAGGITSPATAVLTADSEIAASSTGEVFGTASLLSDGALTPAAAANYAAASVQTGDSSLAAPATTEVAFEVSFQADATMAAPLIAERSLDASMVADSSVAATLVRDADFAASMVAEASMSSVLHRDQDFATALVAEATFAPGLSGQVPLDAVFAGDATLNGEVARERALVASMVGDASLAGTIERERPLGMVSMFGDGSFDGIVSRDTALPPVSWVGDALLDGSIVAEADLYPDIGTANTFDSRNRIAPRLLHTIGGQEVERVGNFESNEEVPGGFISASGTIGKKEYESNRNQYRYGAIWMVQSQAFLETVFVGKLLDPTINANGTVTLAAKGWGYLADEFVERLLYENADINAWTPADSKPHSYGQGNKFAKVEGNEFVAYGGGTVQRVNGQNVNDATGDDLKLQTKGAGAELSLTFTEGEAYQVEVYGRHVEGNACKVHVGVYDKAANKWIRKHKAEINGISDNDLFGEIPVRKTTGQNLVIRVEYIDKNDNGKPIIAHVKWGKTDAVTSDKIQVQTRGSRIVFTTERRSRFFGGEGTGIVFWARDIDLRRIAFTVHVDAPTEDYVLNILGGDGPDGDLNKIGDSIGLTRTDLLEGTRKIDQRLRGVDYDLICLQLKRKEAAEEKKAKRFKLWIEDLRVGSIAVDDDYSMSDVAKDIAGRMDIRRDITDTGVKILPLDVQDTTFGDVLDEVALFNDFRWRILDRGNGPILEFGRWNDRKFRGIPSESNFDLVPIERYTGVRVPCRAEGGTRDWVVVYADKDHIASQPESIYQIDLDDPLPSEEQAKLLGAAVVDHFSKHRWAGTATLTECINENGLRVQAHRIHAGDVLTIPEIDEPLRLRSVRQRDGGTEVTFDDGHALLDKILARRGRLLALGRKVDFASLVGRHTTGPATPDSVMIGFQEDEKDNIRALVDWDKVTSDTRGKGVAIDRYVVQLEAGTRDGGGNFVPALETANGKSRRARRRATVDLREDEDEKDDTDPEVPTRVWFNKLAKPGTWYYRARVMAVDSDNRKSEWSDWTSDYKPNLVVSSMSAPRAVEFDVDQHRMHVAWKGGENDTDDLINNNDVDYQVQVFDHVPTGADGWTTTFRKDKRVRGEGKHFIVKKPGNGNYYARVRSIDSLGNKSDWEPKPLGYATSNRKDPPDPLDIPTIAFTEGDAGDDVLRAVVSFQYSRAFTDDDLDYFAVQFQAEATTPTNTDPKRRETVDIDPLEMNDAQKAVFKGVKGGRECRARYRVVDKRGHKSAWSNWGSASAPLPDIATPNPPTVTYRRRKGEKMIAAVVTWSAVTAYKGIDRYVIQGQSAETDAGPWDTVGWASKSHPASGDADGDSLQAIIKGLRRGHRFRARVRAVDAGNGKSTWSNWS